MTTKSQHISARAFWRSAGKAASGGFFAMWIAASSSQASSFLEMNVTTVPAAEVSVAVSEKDIPPFEALIEETKASIMRAPDEAFTMASEAYELALDLPREEQPLAKATALWLTAEAGLRSGQEAEGRRAADLGLSLIANDENAMEMKASLLLARGRLAMRLSEIRLAVSSYFEAHDLFVELGDTRKESLTLQSLGSIYTQAESYENALDYFRRAAEVYEGDDIVRLSIQNNVGNILRDTGRLVEARANFQRALEIAEGMNSETIVARVLVNLARTELDLGNILEAEENITRALALTESEAGQYWQRFVRDVQAEIALARNQLGEARRFIELAVAPLDPDDSNMVNRELHKTAAEIYRQSEMWKEAFRHQALEHALANEAKSLTASANLALAGAQFQFAEQQLNIERLRIEKLESAARLNEIEEQKQIQQTIIAAGGLVTLIVVAGAFMIFMQQRRVKSINNELSDTVDQLSEEVARREEVEVDLLLAKDKAEAADRMKSIFLATMSHELRTPMNGILGFTEVLLAGELSEEQREQIEIIDQSSGSLLTLINDILDLSQLEAGKFKLREGQFDLRVTAENALKLLRAKAQEKHLDLICHIDPQIAREVSGDEDRLRQILLNLVGNAVKFTEKGGVSLTVTRGEKQGQIHFAVRDTGIGIPQDKVDILFDRFSQIDGSHNRKQAGSGLGLAICKELVAAMNGDIGCTSVHGEGSVFWFTVDIEKTSIPAPAQSEQAGKHVTIIDEFAMRRDMISTILTAHGLKVSAFPQVEDASFEKPDALILAARDESDFWKDAELFCEKSGLDEGRLVGLNVGGTRTDELSGNLEQPITDSSIRRSLHAALGTTEKSKMRPSSAMKSGQVENLRAEHIDAKILVVDDVVANRKLVECILSGMGLTCVTVENGQEAVEIAYTEKFGLVLMDVYMPIMGGIEAAETIRKGDGVNKDTPIFALTASASAEERTDATDAGMNGVLTKPLNVPQLKKTVLEALDPSEASGEDAISA